MVRIATAFGIRFTQLASPVAQPLVRSPVAMDDLLAYLGSIK